MARNTINYTVTDEGRDKGKVFVLTEMDADKGERWAMRALLALANEDVQIPEGLERMGMAGLVQIGIQSLAKLRYETVEPLLEEMWDCVKIIPDPTKPHIIRELFPGDTEEITTRLKLREEVLKLHVDFLKAVAPSLFGNFQAAAQENQKPRRRNA